MSLDWNLSKVKDSTNLCFTGCKDDPDQVEMKWKTKAIIWMTMSVGIGEITERTYLEFYYRTNVIQGLRGMAMEYQITLDDIKAHMGLSTNVFPKESVAKFHKRIHDQYLNDYRWSERQSSTLKEASNGNPR